MVTGTSRDTSTDYDPAQADGGAIAVSLLPALSEAEFMELLVELSVSFAPRRFALAEVHGDYDDGWVIARGMAFENQAVVCSDDGRLIGVYPSAEHALAQFSRRANLRLVWIDPDTEGDA